MWCSGSTSNTPAGRSLLLLLLLILHILLLLLLLLLILLVLLRPCAWHPVGFGREMADGKGRPLGDPPRARRSRAERTAAGHRAKAAADAAVVKLTRELESCFGDAAALRQELHDLHAVFGDTELAQRLLLVAPVLAAKLDGREIEGVKVARRNAASHNFGVPARRLARASMRELNKIQRDGSISDKGGVNEKSITDQGCIQLESSGFVWNPNAPTFVPNAKFDREPLETENEAGIAPSGSASSSFGITTGEFGTTGGRARAPLRALREASRRISRRS